MRRLARVATGQLVGQGHHLGHEQLAGGVVALAIAAQQPFPMRIAIRALAGEAFRACGPRLY